MKRLRCAGCDELVSDYENYGVFVLCTSCDEEMIEDQEKQHEDEVYAAIACGHRRVHVFESDDLT